MGVFSSFTLSQAGMVVHRLRIREEGPWQRSMVINAAGAITTGLVTAVIAIAKFTPGAWIVLILIPLIVAYFLWVKRRYDRVRRELALPEEFADLDWQSYNRMHNHVIVLVKDIDRRLIRALRYAKSLEADKLEAVYVDITGNAGAFERRWDKAGFGVRLTVVESPTARSSRRSSTSSVRSQGPRTITS